MELVVKLLCLAACLGVISAHAFKEEDYRRALQALRILEESSEERRALIDCKAEGEGCTGIIHCCGTLQCYWEDGYSITTKGKCVQCVEETQYCQRDSQCCGGPVALQCDKGNALWVDGTCSPYRSSGECYRDGQCVTACADKSWFTGTCT